MAVPAPEPAQEHDALLPGTRLDEFEILRVLGAGGFGIVYLALDHVLMRQVAIKEFMPATLATRGKGAIVSVRSPSLATTFATGLNSFFNEAQLLARFDHPALVKVHRFWKANGTAYMVMPYYPGQTLQAVRAAMRGSPDEAWLRALLDPLLGALDLLHHEGVYHRDIAPDNILL
ncbi:MAG: protein kinase, partial [Burkholderiaceae bacterium]